MPKMTGIELLKEIRASLNAESTEFEQLFTENTKIKNSLRDSRLRNQTIRPKLV